MTSESADMDFVDNGVFQRHKRRFVAAPVEGAAKENTAARRPARVAPATVDDSGPYSPFFAVGNASGPRVQKHQARVETMAVALWSIDAPAITKGLRQAGYVNMPMMAGSILQPVQVQLRQRRVASQGEKN